MPFLRRLGVPVYGEDRSYLALPDQVRQAVLPAWQAHGYQPAPVPGGVLPPGLDCRLPLFRVPGYHVPKRALVRALAGGLQDRVVRGRVSASGSSWRLLLDGQEDGVDLDARVTVVAAGCGTQRLLRDVLDADAPLLQRIGYTKGHMLCVRGPVDALPTIGTLVTPGLVVVGHLNRAHDTVGEADEVSWYATPMDGEPPRYDQAPDDAVAGVEPEVVARAVERLTALAPALAEAGDRVQASVFAGYKQDIDRQMTRGTLESVDAERPLFVALPSVLANALPNARDAVIRISALGTPRGPRELDEALRGIAGRSVGVGEVNELHPDVEWLPWPRFAARWRAPLAAGTEDV